MHESRLKTIIEPGKTEKLYWRDLWSFRELLYFLVWRDVLIRYKQTTIGIAWALIRPLLTMVIFTIVFGKIADLSSGEDAPYSILVFSGLLPWQFFSSALIECSNSLIGNTNLISKVYFPRLIIPASSVVVSFIDFLIAGMILLLLLIWFNFTPTPSIFALPFFMLMAVAAAIGSGLWLAALNVRYRDVRHIVPFIVQLGLYISPVGFSSEAIPSNWRLVYSLNPMVGVIDGFRWAILGDLTAFYWPALILSTSLISLLLLSGTSYFRHTERTFADVI